MRYRVKISIVTYISELFGYIRSSSYSVQVDPGVSWYFFIHREKCSRICRSWEYRSDLSEPTAISNAPHEGSNNKRSFMSNCTIYKGDQRAIFLSFFTNVCYCSFYMNAACKSKLCTASNCNA